MSLMRCDVCTRSVDTDYAPGGFLVDGEAFVCDVCIEDKDQVLEALHIALSGLNRLHFRRQRTDNAYANSGRLDVQVRRIRAVEAEIKRVQEDFDKWLESV